MKLREIESKQINNNKRHKNNNNKSSTCLRKRREKGKGDSVDERRIIHRLIA